MTTEELWSQFNEHLLGYIVARTGDTHYAEDILQDVFLRVHRSDTNSVENISGWLYATTKNAIVDFYRKKNREKNANETLRHEVEPFENSERANPQLSKCLAPLVKTLTPEHQRAIDLIDFEGLAQQDAADLEGITLSGMKSRVQRGRKALLKTLADCCEIERDGRGGVIDFVKRLEFKCCED